MDLEPANSSDGSRKRKTDDEDNGSAKQSKPDAPSVSYRTKLTSILSEEILKTLPIQVKMELVNEGVGDPESAKSDTELRPLNEDSAKELAETLNKKPGIKAYLQDKDIPIANKTGLMGVLMGPLGFKRVSASSTTESSIQSVLVNNNTVEQQEQSHLTHNVAEQSKPELSISQSECHLPTTITEVLSAIDTIENPKQIKYMVLDYIEKYTPNEEERERIMVTLAQKAQSRIKQPTTDSDSIPTITESLHVFTAPDIPHFTIPLEKLPDHNHHDPRLVAIPGKPTIYRSTSQPQKCPPETIGTPPLSVLDSNAQAKKAQKTTNKPDNGDDKTKTATNIFVFQSIAKSSPIGQTLLTKATTAGIKDGLPSVTTPVSRFSMPNVQLPGGSITKQAANPISAKNNGLPTPTTITNRLCHVTPTPIAPISPFSYSLPQNPRNSAFNSGRTQTSTYQDLDQPPRELERPFPPIQTKKLPNQANSSISTNQTKRSISFPPIMETRVDSVVCRRLKAVFCVNENVEVWIKVSQPSYPNAFIYNANTLEALPVSAEKGKYIAGQQQLEKIVDYFADLPFNGRPRMLVQRIPPWNQKLIENYFNARVGRFIGTSSKVSPTKPQPHIKLKWPRIGSSILTQFAIASFEGSSESETARLVNYFTSLGTFDVDLNFKNFKQIPITCTPLGNTPHVLSIRSPNGGIRPVTPHHTPIVVNQGTQTYQMANQLSPPPKPRNATKCVEQYENAREFILKRVKSLESGGNYLDAKALGLLNQNLCILIASAEKRWRNDPKSKSVSDLLAHISTDISKNGENAIRTFMSLMKHIADLCEWQVHGQRKSNSKGTPSARATEVITLDF